MSARANALALSSSLAGAALLRALNGVAIDVYFTHATEIPQTFHPRHADFRRYRYFLPGDPTRLSSWRSLTRLFRGPVDARTFGRGLPFDRPQLRTIDSVTVDLDGDWLQVDLKAPSFVWGMVRKIIAAIEQVESGRLSEEQLLRSISGEERISIPLAAPEPLVLWEVGYPVAWQVVASGPSRRQQRYLAEESRKAHLRERLFSNVLPFASGGAIERIRVIRRNSSALRS